MRRINSMIKLNELRIRPEADQKRALYKKAAKQLGVREGEILGLEILRRSIDARKKPDVFFSYTVGVSLRGERGYLSSKRGRKFSQYKPQIYQMPQMLNSAYKQNFRPVVIGAGPAGLFAALILASFPFCRDSPFIHS